MTQLYQPQMKQEEPQINQRYQQYQPQIYQGQQPQIHSGYKYGQPQLLQGQEQPQINFGWQPQIEGEYYVYISQTSYGQQSQISYEYRNVNYGYQSKEPQTQYEQPLTKNSQSSHQRVVVAQSKQKKTETMFYKQPIWVSDFQQLQNELNKLQQKYQFHFN